MRRFVDDIYLQNIYSAKRSNSLTQEEWDKREKAYRKKLKEEEEKRQKKFQESFKKKKIKDSNMVQDFAANYTAKKLADEKKENARIKKLSKSDNKFNIAKNFVDNYNNKSKNTIPEKSIFKKELDYRNLTGKDYKTDQNIYKYENRKLNDNDYVKRYKEKFNITGPLNTIEESKILAERKALGLNNPDKLREATLGKNWFDKNIVNPVSRFTTSFLDSSLFKDTDKVDKSRYRTKSSTNIPEAAGELASYIAPTLPGKVFSGGGKIATKLGSKFAPKIAPKLGKFGQSAITKTLANKGIEGIGSGLAVKSAEEGTKYLFGNKKFSAGNVKKSATDIGKTGLEFGAFNVGLSGAGMLGKKAFKGIGNMILKRSSTGSTIVEPLPSEAKLSFRTGEVKPEKFIQRKSKYKDVMDMHNSKFNDYKNAEKEWENAVQTIQNRFGHNQLTRQEEMLVESELGINLESLANKYDDAHNQYLEAKKS